MKRYFFYRRQTKSALDTQAVVVMIRIEIRTSFGTAATKTAASELCGLTKASGVRQNTAAPHPDRRDDGSEAQRYEGA